MWDFFPPSFLFEEQKLKEMEVDETECWILKTAKEVSRVKGDESGKCDATTVTTFSMLMMTGDEFSLIPLHVLATLAAPKLCCHTPNPTPWLQCRVTVG